MDLLVHPPSKVKRLRGEGRGLRVQVGPWEAAHMQGAGQGLMNPGRGQQQKAGTSGSDGLDPGTAADLGPGSAVFLLRIVRGSSSKRVWTESAATGTYHRALWARGQWREAMRSERGPPTPRSASGRARRSEGVSGAPWGPGCSHGVRTDPGLPLVNRTSGPGDWRWGFPVAGLWTVQ